LIMSLDLIRRRFVQEIKLRAYDDGYITREEEREILKAAVELNVTLESAREALRQVCRSQDYVLESALRERIVEVLDQSASDDGRIDEREFHHAVEMIGELSRGRLTPNAIKRMVLEEMERDAARVKTGLFTNWHTRLRKELGLT